MHLLQSGANQLGQTFDAGKIHKRTEMGQDRRTDNKSNKFTLAGVELL